MKKMNLFWAILFAVLIFGSNTFAVDPPGSPGAPLPISDDAILSQHVKEADGITGQDTNAGSGIKTGHIQNGAVTPAKIGFYRNVIVVASNGGDFNNPVDAMNAITDASASNPYLVKMMPGIYNIGGNIVRMKDYVDIEGSGENITVIEGSENYVLFGASNAELRFLTVKSTCSYSHYDAVHAVVAPTKMTHVTVNVTKTCYGGGIAIIANGSTLSDVSAIITGDSGVVAISAAGSTMNKVTALASGSATVYGIICSAGQNTMNNVTAEALGGTGRGVTAYRYSIVTMNSVTAKGNYIGVLNESSTFYINNSTIIGPSRTIWTTSVYAPAATYVSNSKLDGGSADAICAGVYDENYVFYANTCP